MRVVFARGIIRTLPTSPSPPVIPNQSLFHNIHCYSYLRNPSHTNLFAISLCTTKLSVSGYNVYFVSSSSLLLKVFFLMLLLLNKHRVFVRQQWPFLCSGLSILFPDGWRFVGYSVAHEESCRSRAPSWCCMSHCLRISTYGCSGCAHTHILVLARQPASVFCAWYLGSQLRSIALQHLKRMPEQNTGHWLG